MYSVENLKIINATLAQLVEQLTRNEQVAGSSPVSGSGYLTGSALNYFNFDFISLFKIH